MQVTLRGRASGFFAPWRARNIADAWSQAGENWFEMADYLILAIMQ